MMSLDLSPGRAVVAAAARALSTWLVGAATLAEPVRFTSGHVDLRVDFEPPREPPLTLVVSDDDQGVDFEPASTVLVVAEAARLQLPADIPPLGTAGDPVWVLPQSQDPSLLFVGWSGEGNPPEAFDGPFQLRLVNVEGPGHVYLWQSDIGSMEFFFNSADGFTEADTFPVPVGGHAHANWGFSTNGLYRVSIQVIAQRVGDSPPLFSPPVTFSFHVEPLPASPSPFAAWQARHWPGVTDDAVIGESADPDGDRRLNLEEYAVGTDPTRADAPATPQPAIRKVVGAGGDTQVQITLEVPQAASDLLLRLHSSPTAGAPWTPGNEPEWEAPATNGLRKATWRLPAGGTGSAGFHRVGYRLAP